MKSKSLIILLLFCVNLGFGQMRSKLDSAINTPGSLCKYEVLQTANFKSLRFDAVKYSNLENFSVLSGLKFIYKIQSGKELKSMHAYIDQKEVESLLMTLQYMRTMLKSKTMPANYTEIKFTTTAGFQVMLYTILNDKNNLSWKFAVIANVQNDKSYLECTMDDIAILEEALSALKNKI